MTDLPSPPIAAEVDLTDFGFMPLDVRRLRDSKLAASVDGEQFRCAVLLWCASWHQLPAGSLPDDDIELANLAGFGRMVPQWKKIRTGALYGWTKCSDGRLYHAVVVEKAAEAWSSKLDAHYRRECDRLRKENKRRLENRETTVRIPSFEQWNSERRVRGSPADVPRTSGGIPAEVPRKSKGRPADSVLKGQGQGEIRDKNPPTPRASDELSDGKPADSPSPGDPPEPRGDEGGAEPTPTPSDAPPVPSPAVRAVQLTEAEKMAAFQRVMAAYPKPPRWFDEQKAERNCQLRIERNRETWASLEARAGAYRDHCDTGGVSGREHAMNPDKFFEGDKGPWAHDWKPVATKADTARELAAKREADEFQRLKDGRAARGLADFRDPYPHESAAAYETALRLAERDLTPARAPRDMACVTNLVHSKTVKV